LTIAPARITLALRAALPTTERSMPVDPRQTIYYKRARFSTRLPVDRRYSPAHYWLREVSPGTWQVGLTRFATRMLGEMVEHGFQAQPGEAVSLGQALGWLEGFKAVADVYCVGEGTFGGANPRLEQDLTLVDTDTYDSGWLYLLHGQPAADSLDVHGYMALLDAAIDKLLSKTQAEADACPQPGTS
jgi:glycine cleavage system H protein